MIRPKPKEAKSVVTILEPAAYDRLVKVVLRLRTPEQQDLPLGGYRQLQLYAYEWLSHLGVLSDDKIRWLLGEVDTDLKVLGQTLDNHFDDGVTKLPPFQIVVTDGRYATWTNRTCFSDMQDECSVSEMPGPGCTHVIADMVPIFAKKQAWLVRLRRGTDASGHQHHAGGPANAGPGRQEQDPAGRPPDSDG